MFEILFSGCRSGRFPLEYARAHHGDRVTVHAYDAYQARKIREDVGAKSNVAVVCADGLPEEARYDRAFYYATSKLVSAELELDTLQTIHLHLKEGAQLFAEGVAPETLGKLFGKIEVTRPSRRAPVKCVCTKKGELKRVRSFAASFEASVPGGPKLPFVSLPGCFCHRRADLGGLSLAETACATFNGIKGLKILDMGCGCGFVGLLVADHLRTHGVPPELTLLDSHARALAAARVNSKRLNFSDATFILSCDGLPPDAPADYDLFLGNPPYYGDWKIAETFVKTAFRALRRGGRCLTVAKSEGGLQELQAQIFGKTEVFRRRGYFVFSSIRP